MKLDGRHHRRRWWRARTRAACLSAARDGAMRKTKSPAWGEGKFGGQQKYCRREIWRAISAGRSHAPEAVGVEIHVVSVHLPATGYMPVEWDCHIHQREIKLTYRDE